MLSIYFKELLAVQRMLEKLIKLEAKLKEAIMEVSVGNTCN